jgi:hypothetical protein
MKKSMDSEVVISELMAVSAELEIFSRIPLHLGKHMIFSVP